MKIIWNKYTWYSKLAAVIFFIILLPIWMFYLGFVYEKTMNEINKYSYSNTVQKVNYKNFGYGIGLSFPSSFRIEDIGHHNGDNEVFDTSIDLHGLNRSRIEINQDDAWSTYATNTEKILQDAEVLPQCPTCISPQENTRSSFNTKTYTHKGYIIHMGDSEFAPGDVLRYALIQNGSQTVVVEGFDLKNIEQSDQVFEDLVNSIQLWSPATSQQIPD